MAYWALRSRIDPTKWIKSSIPKVELTDDPTVSALWTTKEDAEAREKWLRERGHGGYTIEEMRL